MVLAVTLDVAGTLLEPAPSVGGVYAEVARSHGYSADATHLNAKFPAAFKAIHEKWSTPYGSHEEDARRFWFAVIDATFAESVPLGISHDIYDAFSRAHRWKVLPNVREALTIIKEAGLPMAVVSNFDNRLKPLLKELDLGPFVTIVTSSSVGNAKPHPAALKAACKAMHVAPSDVLHLGNSEKEDGAMCKAAGAQWLPCGPKGIPLSELTALLGDRVS